MKVTDEELADLYRRHTAAGPARAACLSAEELGRLAREELDPAARQRAAAHLSACSDCALELRMIRTLEPWSEELAVQLRDDPGTAAPAPVEAEASQSQASVTDLNAFRERHATPRAPRRRWLTAVIAAGLAVAAVGTYQLAQRTPPDPFATTSDVRRGGAPGVEVVPEDQAFLGLAPERLAWPAQPGATGYRVRIFDDRAEVVWESAALDETEARLGPEIRERLAAAEDFSWTVEVSGPVQRSRLGPYRFTIRHEPSKP